MVLAAGGAFGNRKQRRSTGRKDGVMVTVARKRYFEVSRELSLAQKKRDEKQEALEAAKYALEVAKDEVEQAHRSVEQAWADAINEAEASLDAEQAEDEAKESAAGGVGDGADAEEVAAP